MRILHITDSHGTVKSPEGRKDIFYVTFLKKLYELGFVCKKLNVDMVIHTGDLFHSAKVSNKFAGQVSEMIKAMGVPFYVVPGNHDIEGYSVSTIDQTTLGLLSKTGVITLLDRENPMRFEIEENGEVFTVALSGQEYYANIDSGNDSDFDMQQDEGDFNILAIHGYIADTPQHPDIKHTLASSISTDADVILSGHYHRQFEYNGPDFEVFNPGSMMRVEQTAYNKTHMPQYGILDVGLDNNGQIVYQYKFHEFRIAQPSTTVFDYNAQYTQKHASITLEGFKTSIANTMSNMAPTTDIPKIIQDICANTQFKGQGLSRMTNLALKAYNDTLQNVPDEYEAPQGYIEAPQVKKIESVHIKGFQSHEDSLVEFEDGLNIIIGESNNGKTSILRAIMWVIDNKPAGTDFIMAGKDECVVRITFDDMTFIERGRTRKDTGYYRVRYFDEGGHIQDETYRGFSNAIPIQVTNNHQMPIVNVTKDIETHLNVLSQLDPPFLISESPQNKAAAIGRITGTHVLDAAVKETTRVSHGMKISMKEHKEDLLREQTAFDALPDAAITHDVAVNYERIYEALTKRSCALSAVQANWAEQIQIRNEVMRTVKKASQAQTVMALTPIVDATNCRVGICKNLHGLYGTLEQVNQSIETHKSVLAQNKPLSTFGPAVTQILERVRRFNRLKKAYQDYLDNIEKESQLSEKVSTLHQVCDNTRRIVAYVAKRLNTAVNVNYEYNNYTYGNKQLEEAQKIHNSHIKQSSMISKQIAKVSKDMLDFVLQQGICPCCGQMVQSDIHARHIINYMEAKT